VGEWLLLGEGALWAWGYFAATFAALMGGGSRYQSFYGKMMLILALTGDEDRTNLVFEGGVRRSCMPCLKGD